MIRLPDARLLTNKRASKERINFAEAVAGRIRAGGYGEALTPLAADLVSYLPRTQRDHEELQAIAQHSISIGAAVADEERARGWAREGQEDAVVQSAIDWDLKRLVKEAHQDWIASALAEYTLDAGYYLARTGGAGRAAVVHGMGEFAQAINEESEQS